MCIMLGVQYSDHLFLCISNLLFSLANLFFYHFFSFLLHFYRPKQSFGQGNIFTSVCQEFCPRGGGVPDQAPPGWRTPLDGEPPWRRTHPPMENTPRNSRLRNTVNVRPVCILLECILVVPCD